jgi:hypothetical protein
MHGKKIAGMEWSTGETPALLIFAFRFAENLTHDPDQA